MEVPGLAHWNGELVENCQWYMMAESTSKPRNRSKSRISKSNVRHTGRQKWSSAEHQALGKSNLIQARHGTYGRKDFFFLLLI